MNVLEHQRSYVLATYSSEAIGHSYSSVPVAGVLDDPPLALLEVDEGDAEALGVTLGPFKIVHKPPEMVGPDSFHPAKL